MKKIIDYINKRVLIKVVWLHSATVITKISAGFLITKFVAVLIGAEGLALIGNLRNFLTAVQNFATVGLYKAIVKYISECKNDVVKLSKVISTTYYIGFAFTFLISLLCYFNSGIIENILFSTRDKFDYVIRILALAIPFYALNMFCFALLNGFSKYKFLMILNILGQILGLGVTLILIYQNKLDGALVSVVISPSLIFLITFVGILNRRNLMKHIKVSRIDFSYLKRFSSHGIMAIVTGIAVPIVMLSIRNYIIDNEGMTDAGYWEAMNRISSYYLMFINSILTLYFLPRFSEIESKAEFRREVFSFYKNFIPVFAMGLFVIYLLKPFIVQLFLTESFVFVEKLFLWQLLGDLLKIMSLVIAYQFLAKKMFAHFIFTEIALMIFLYIFSVYGVNTYGVIGANMAHFASYALYFVMILLIFSNTLFGMLPEERHEES